METINTEFSNFPNRVAVYYPKGDSVRIIHFTKDDYSEQTAFHFTQIDNLTQIENNKYYPFDNIIRCVSIGGRDVYYWYTGLRLLKIPQKQYSSQKNDEIFPLFGFLNIRLPIPLALFQPTIGMEYFNQNEDWHSQMSDMKLLAQEEYEEYKDMPLLIPSFRNVSKLSYANLSIEIIKPNFTDFEFSSPRKSSESQSSRHEVVSEMDEEIPTYTAKMDILLEAAKKIWWNQWRSEGYFMRKVKIMDLDLYSSQELLHYLRFVKVVNTRCQQSAQIPIDITFTMDECVGISNNLTNMSPNDKSELMNLVNTYTF